MTAETWNSYIEGSHQLIWEGLSQIFDPEIGQPITEMDLVDEVEIENHIVKVKFHLTMPYYPAPFALRIAAEMKERLLTVPGINKVSICLLDHVMSEEINRQINNEV